MTIRLHPYATAGSLVLDLDERPDAGATCAIRLPLGGVADAAAVVTIDSVSTTLSGAAAAGASSLSLTSASGVTAGRRYLVGGGEDAGGEVVTVRSVSASTATLVRPLARAAASGATFQSARVSVAITAAAVAAIGRNYRCELTYLVGTAARPVLSIPFDVTRYAADSTLTLEDVRAVDPTFSRTLPQGTYWPELRERAWQMVLRRVAATKAPGALVGTIMLTEAHCYAVRYLALEAGGAESQAARELMARRFNEETEACLNACAFDDDQDQAVESHEAWRRTILVSRG